MATWKKVIVSGSSANLTTLQVDNLTSGSVVIGGGSGNLSVTPINGTGNIVASTGATNVSISGSFSGSFQGNGSGLTGISASFLANALSQGTGIVPFSFDGTVARTVAISGAAQLSNNAVTKWNSTDGKFVNSNITDDGTSVSISSNTKITGSLNMLLTGSSTLLIEGNSFGQTQFSTAGPIVLNPGTGGVGMAGLNQYIQANYFIGTTAGTVLTGSFTGSFAGDGSQLTGIAANLAITGSNGSSGSVNLKTQGLTITGTANEIETSVSSQTVTIGLPDDVTIGQNLTVNNNLTVLGTASFQNTENLQVADRFILLASGSNSAGDGGLVIQQGVQNVGEVFAFDSGVTRWAFTSSFNAGSSSFTPDAFVAAALIGAGTDPTAVASRYQVGGNIFIGTDEGIWIYS
jgi:hypothetical protein